MYWPFRTATAGARPRLPRLSACEVGRDQRIVLARLHHMGRPRRHCKTIDVLFISFSGSDCAGHRSGSGGAHTTNHSDVRILASVMSLSPAESGPRRWRLIPRERDYWQGPPFTGSVSVQHKASPSSWRPVLQKKVSRFFCSQRPPGHPALIS